MTYWPAVLDVEALMYPGEPPSLVEFLQRLRPPWMAEAACRGVATSVFFPERGESPERARELCERCPVRGPCLDYAVSEDVEGWWAATSARHRAALRREAS